MFTGIVEDIGKVVSITPGEKDSTFVFEVKKINADELTIGESIAINGACLTVVSIEGGSFTVDASHETLSRTNLGNLDAGSEVNIERSMKADGRFGGHIVTGHVDGQATVQNIEEVGKSLVFWFNVPDELSKYFITKGSVAVDGISLTVNEVVNNNFSVNIIPHTQVETIISQLKVGSVVNIECDIVGKYVEKFITNRSV